MISVFQILHLFSLFLLVGVTLAAFASRAPEKRKQFLKWSGIASLLVVLSGFGLAGILKYGFPMWLNVKILCWLFLSAVCGFAFRQPEKAKMWVMCSLGAVALAVSMVYLRPF